MQTVFQQLPVQRLSPIPSEAYQDYAWFRDHIVASRRPHVITGMVPRWPAYGKWSMDYFRTAYGQVDCKVLLDLPERGNIYRNTTTNFLRDMKLGDFIEHLEQAQKPCYYRRRDSSHTPGLDADLGFADISPDDATGAYLWIGSAGTRTGLHFDQQDNVLCQMQGDKDLLLIAPQYSSCLYPYVDSITKSQVDVDDVDLSRFPKFAKIEAQHIRLRAGEVIFIPYGWWHAVQSASKSISVNHEFGARMGWGGMMASVNAGGLPAWARVGRDFLRYGLMKRAFQLRLADDPPFGKVIYDLVSSGVQRRLAPARKA